MYILFYEKHNLFLGDIEYFLKEKCGLHHDQLFNYNFKMFINILCNMVALFNGYFHLLD